MNEIKDSHIKSLYLPVQQNPAGFCSMQKANTEYTDDTVKIHRLPTLKRKQLSVNYDKSKYIILGSNKFRKDTMEEMEKDPMKMGNVIINKSEIIK